MTYGDKGIVGSIPEIYDTYSVPLIFETYTRDLAKRVAALDPASVLETAARSGIGARARRLVMSHWFYLRNAGDRSNGVASATPQNRAATRRSG